LVNYDPVDKTVLANEQVDANGCSWRSGAKVEKRKLKQWFLRISEFREQLLQDLDCLAEGGLWPERVLAMQKNWLGKSQGARIKFGVSTPDEIVQPAIEVFTTRPDTILGVQYLALAATHPIVDHFAKHDPKLQEFLNKMPELPPDSKAGYLLPDIRAINPLVSEESIPDAVKGTLPIFVAPYVLGDYGDGAVMGVPGHDTRDHAFWKHSNPESPARHVISPVTGDSNAASKDEPFVHHGQLNSNNGPFSGQTSTQAIENIITVLEKKNLGTAAETWRLRDWLVSRQRYWGAPIPIIHCGSCGPVPVPDDELPVKLPQLDGHWLKGKAGNPLDDAHGWKHIPCPKCGADATRDTDTMDTFVDSSWYFMRFADPKNETSPFSPEAANATLPVDIYVGGVEHAILHLLYARFISKFLSTTPLWPVGSNPEIRGEPFKKLLTQGMVHGRTYSDPDNGRFLKPSEVDLSTPSKPIVISSGKVANISFEKMSKSKYNGVDPTTCMSKYGADATRAHILFQAPVPDVLEWDEEKISGITRWLNRVYDHVQLIASLPENPDRLNPGADIVGQWTPKLYLLQAAEHRDNIKKSKEERSTGKLQDLTPDVILKSYEADTKLWRAVQQTIVNVNEAYSTTYSLNTVVSDLMALTNLIIEHNKTYVGSTTTSSSSSKIVGSATEALIQMMAPITPVFSEECWIYLSSSGSAEELQTDTTWSEKDSVFSVPFPQPDGTLELLVPDTQSCTVQVNGKLRFVANIPIPPAKIAAKGLEELVLQEIMKTPEGRVKFGEAKNQIDVRKAKKIIVVRNGRLINFVM
jgi:leucyl-tRNA synthetase